MENPKGISCPPSQKGDKMSDEEITFKPRWNVLRDEAMRRLVILIRKAMTLEQKTMHITFEGEWSTLTISVGRWPFKKEVIMVKNSERMMWDSFDKPSVECSNEDFENLAVAIAKELEVAEIEIGYFKQ